MIDGVECVWIEFGLFPSLFESDPEVSLSWADVTEERQKALAEYYNVSLDIITDGIAEYVDYSGDDERETGESMAVRLVLEREGGRLFDVQFEPPELIPFDRDDPEFEQLVEYIRDERFADTV